jgi:hypothetical protein
MKKTAFGDPDGRADVVNGGGPDDVAGCLEQLGTSFGAVVRSDHGKLERAGPDSRNGQLTDASSIGLVPAIWQPPHDWPRVRCRIALTKSWQPEGRIIRSYCRPGKSLGPLKD